MYELHSVTWLAGLFEGEGCFTFHRDRPKQMTIQMTDKDVLNKVQQIFGGNIVSCKKQKEHHKDSWKWYIAGQESVDLAKEIYPFLGLRRSKRCQEYIENYKSLEAKRKREGEELDHIISLRDKGLTHQQIADTLGLERSSVTHRLNRRGVYVVREA